MRDNSVLRTQLTVLPKNVKLFEADNLIVTNSLIAKNRSLEAAEVG